VHNVENNLPLIR